MIPEPPPTLCAPAAGHHSLSGAKYWDINFCTGFPLLPPWRGKVGMGGNGWPNVSGCDPTSPPPSPSPVEGEGKKTSVQVLSVCVARLQAHPCRQSGYCAILPQA